MMALLVDARIKLTAKDDGRDISRRSAASAHRDAHLHADAVYRRRLMARVDLNRRRSVMGARPPCGAQESRGSRATRASLDVERVMPCRLMVDAGMSSRRHRRAPARKMPSMVDDWPNAYSS